jgi:hypothetical protein
MPAPSGLELFFELMTQGCASQGEAAPWAVALRTFSAEICSASVYGLAADD